MADVKFQYAIANLTSGINTVTLKKAIGQSDIKTALRAIRVDDIENPTLVDVVWKGALDAADKTTFDGDPGASANDPPSVGSIMGDHDGSATPIEDKPQDVTVIAKDALTAPLVRQGPRPSVTQRIDVSHNWSDATTWWPKSIKKDDVTLSLDSGTTYKYPNPLDGDNPMPFWIDAHHGKIYRERTRHKNLVAIVTVDNVPQVVAGIGQTVASQGVDCEIDYAAGLVTFGEDPGGIVRASFYHVDDQAPLKVQSEYSICAPGSKKVILERVETQFTKGIDMKSECHFAGFLPLYWITIQTDATLDPSSLAFGGTGAKCTQGQAFRIGDKDNLHAKFGDIPGVGNGDIVMYLTDREYDEDGWVVWFDVSEHQADEGIHALQKFDNSTHKWNGISWEASVGLPTPSCVPETLEIYPNFQMFLDNATGNYSVIPAGMVAGDRGCDRDILQIPFEWLGTKTIDGALQSHLRVWLDNGSEWGPDRTYRGTASFYGQLHD